MARMATALLAFNRGLVSRLAVARVDLKRMALSAERMVNWMPRVLGPMSLRPGMKYTGATKSNAKSKTIPFVFSTDDTARIELTDSVMRVWVDDALVTRASVSTAITNGTFDSDLTGWTDADEGSSVSEWVAGGYMSLKGTGAAFAIRRQTVTVAGGDQNVRHAINITVTRGRVQFKVGSSSGGDEYIRETSLGTGVHSLAFTPTGASAYIEISNSTQYAALVDSCVIAPAGVMELATPWDVDDLDLIRHTASADVTWVACAGVQERRIERRAADSWSIVLYQPNDGPFRVANTTPTTIAASATTGDITLTASKALFRSGHAGGLFRITSTKQKTSASLTAEDQFSGTIRVTGTGGQRAFSVTRRGTFSATLTLQYSVEEPGDWVDYATYTTAGSTSVNDGLNNQIIYYRIGIKSGGYTSGTAAVVLNFSSGSQSGVVRITAVSSGTSATAAVLSELGSTAASSDWEEGLWSGFSGYPSAVSLYEGRLWWAGKEKIVGSVSDAFDSFDPDYEGDAGPINRTIGSGPVDSISWLLPMNRLLAGTDGAEISLRSTSFDEPLTPGNFNAKPISTQGAANINAIRVDATCVYVQRSGRKLFELSFDVESQDYRPVDITAIVPEIGNGGFTDLAIQRQPDTHIHAVRTDGKVAVLVYDKLENVNCWVEVETDGIVEDVTVLPGEEEDAVYYTVKRTINGNTVRYHEKWAMQSECVGGTLNKQADSFIEYSGTATTTITGLTHLEGKAVVVWGDGKDLGEYVVASGQITGLTQSVTAAIVGLGYTAQWKSARLANGNPQVFNKRGKVSRIGLLLADTHAQGIQYGPDFDTLDSMPLYEQEQAVDPDSIWTEYDLDMMEFNGEWTTDSRVCIQAAAPRPATVLAISVAGEVNDKS